ncbi:MAG: ClpX C4-type zinc finger protein [Acidimicrobiales bacterium]|jgi:hypothetical protein
MTVTTQRRHLADCSFCFKSNTEVETLVSGPGVFICDACVALCQLIIQNKPSSGPPVPLSPFENMGSVDEVLRDLPQVARAGAQMERYLTSGVRRARELGASWARVGEAFGMTRQSAWERFSGEE